ncbi:MAG: hypothetical protein ACYDA1_01055 [Vulcanimicrobiaceae bacterium]
MDRSEAHQHLELVGEILSRAESRIECVPSLFIAWGIAAALSDVAWQLIASGGSQMPQIIAFGAASKISLGAAPVTLLWISGFAFCLAIINQILVVRRLRQAERRSLMGMQIGRMFGATFGTAMILAYGAPQIFHSWAGPTLFNAAAAIALWFLAQQGDRRAGVATGILIASILAAAWVEPLRGYILAAGWILGYVGLGVAYALQRRNG